MHGTMSRADIGILSCPARLDGLRDLIHEQPEDIVNAILFLATTLFATGSVVRVDRGGVIG